MAKQQQQPRRNAPAQAPRPAAPVRRQEPKRDNVFTRGSRDFVFGRTNFIIMGVGTLLVLLGLAAMSGGAMTDPNEWKPEEIYSFRRITLAPIMMVLGFVVVVYGIFKKEKQADSAATGDV